MIFQRLITLNRTVLVVLALAVAFWFIYQPAEHVVPIKPASVPLGARWLGGIDGGVWIECRPMSAHTVECEFFADVTGVQVDKAVFISPDREKKLRVDNAFYESLSYFDGERIRTNTGDFFVKESGGGGRADKHTRADL